MFNRSDALRKTVQCLESRVTSLEIRHPAGFASAKISVQVVDDGGAPLHERVVPRNYNPVVLGWPEQPRVRPLRDDVVITAVLHALMAHLGVEAVLQGHEVKVREVKP